MRYSMSSGCLVLLAVFFFLILFPFFLTDVMLTALSKLGLSKDTSVLVLIGILFGGMINVPVKRIPREEQLDANPFELYGFHRFFPRMTHRRSYTIIAVNIGGCVIPCLIVVYELMRIMTMGPFVLMSVVGSIGINVALCYKLARPIAHVGIALPPLLPAAVAALCGFLFMRELAPLVAFTSGVMGPLIGADLLHLRDIKNTQTGLASIGGAGTFDGIVISGLVATLLV